MQWKKLVDDDDDILSDVHAVAQNCRLNNDRKKGMGTIAASKKTEILGPILNCLKIPIHEFKWFSKKWTLKNTTNKLVYKSM